MSSQRRRSVMRHPGIASIGCGSRLSKLYTLFSSSSSSSASPMKQRVLNSPNSSSSATTSTSNMESIDSATFEELSPEILAASRQRGNKKKDKERVAEKIVQAVVMESSDAYTDFRDSMLVMMVEEEMYELEDLLELLRRLLSLNSPDLHHIILRAFTEIWNGVFLQTMAVEDAPAPRP